MKIFVNRESLLAALIAAGPIIPLRGVRPVLRLAMFTGRPDGCLTIEATDLDTAIRYEVKAESVEAPASLCLPCSTLTALLKSYSDEIIEINTTGTKAVMILGADKYEILGEVSNEFPNSIPALAAETPQLTVSAGSLAAALKRGGYASAMDPGRYSINGVFVTMNKENLVTVSTDGRRMALSSARNGVCGSLESAILPTKLATELGRLCESLHENEVVTIAKQSNQFIASVAGVTLAGLVVDGNFPQYEKVIPKDCDAKIMFSAAVMVDALQRASNMTAKESRAVSIEFSDSHAIIHASSADKGTAAVRTDISGAKIDGGLRLNALYLIEALSQFGSETVTLHVHSNDLNRPVMIVHEDSLAVLMPINLKE